MDGAHWNGQRKLKKGDINGKGGHLGCPSIYNFNLYKEFEDVKINSQGREQTNALIERCSQTLRQKNFFNFMRYMNCFFAIRNLMTSSKVKLN